MANCYLATDRLLHGPDGGLTASKLPHSQIRKFSDRALNTTPTTLSGPEREVVVLASIMGIIDDMVNHTIFSFPGSGTTLQPFPKTSTMRAYFVLRLSDFLSQTDQNIGIAEIPYLRHLTQIAEDPSLGDATGLRASVKQFVDWLNEKKEFAKVWLSTLDIQTSLIPSRLSWLKVTGNLQKHDALRSSGTAEDIVKWLIEQGHTVDRMEVLGALDDFREWLTEDALSAYIPKLGFLLNDLRWETFGYLRSYYQRHHVIEWDNALQFHRYRFTPDPRITTPFACAQRHALLKWVRKEPIVSRFSIDPTWHQVEDVFASR